MPFATLDDEVDATYTLTNAGSWAASGEMEVRKGGACASLTMGATAADAFTVGECGEAAPVSELLQFRSWEPAAFIEANSTLVEFSPPFSETNYPVSYDELATLSWDFGDGTVTGFIPAAYTAHTYDTPGTYTVTVTGRDSVGGELTTTNTITVGEPSPIVPHTTSATAGPGVASVAVPVPSGFTGTGSVLAYVATGPDATVTATGLQYPSSQVSGSGATGVKLTRLTASNVAAGGAIMVTRSETSGVMRVVLLHIENSAEFSTNPSSGTGTSLSFAFSNSYSGNSLNVLIGVAGAPASGTTSLSAPAGWDTLVDETAGYNGQRSILVIAQDQFRSVITYPNLPLPSITANQATTWASWRIAAKQVDGPTWEWPGN